MSVLGDHWSGPNLCSAIQAIAKPRLGSAPSITLQAIEERQDQVTVTAPSSLSISSAARSAQPRPAVL